MKRPPAKHTDQHQRDQLEQGQQVLHHTKGADAAQIDQGAQPDRPDGRGHHQQRVLEGRNKHLQVAHQRHGNGRIADPGGLPIGPGTQIAGKAAETIAGIGVGPAGGGIEACQAGKGQGQQHRTDTGNQPAHQAQAAESRQAGRQQKYPGADHIADHQGRAGPEAHTTFLPCCLGHALTPTELLLDTVDCIAASIRAVLML